MTNEWFQVEFYSYQDHRWVPLFARETSSAEAELKAKDWLGGSRSRVVKVTQTREVIREYGVNESQAVTHREL